MTVARGEKIAQGIFVRIDHARVAGSGWPTNGKPWRIWLNRLICLLLFEYQQYWKKHPGSPFGGAAARGGPCYGVCEISYLRARSQWAFLFTTNQIRQRQKRFQEELQLWYTLNRFQFSPL